MILRSLSAPDAEKFYTLMCTAAGRELPREAFAQALAQALEQTGRRIVLAFEGPEAVGFADTEVRFPFSECAPVGVIHEFYVREDARGRNVGSACWSRLPRSSRPQAVFPCRRPAPAST
ncbi:MAG: GNAT family N-acetyltransferase [Ruthenibacterium lactatiformans]